MRSFSQPIRLFVVLCFLATRLTNSVVAAEKVTPPLRAVSTAQVGAEILHQGEVYQRPAIHLSREIKFGENGAYALSPGYYVRGGSSDGWEYYSPGVGPDAGRVIKAPGAITLQGAFHYSNDGKTIGLITNFYQAINADAKGVRRTTRPAYSSEKIQRFLVFEGKTGNKIKLSYRELWKNITRPSVAVYIEFDLSESKFVEIQGARLEVIDSSPTSLRYRVIRAFESSEQ